VSLNPEWITVKRWLALLFGAVATTLVTGFLLEWAAEPMDPSGPFVSALRSLALLTGSVVCFLLDDMTVRATADKDGSSRRDGGAHGYM
jgi:preprotein translocase subunit SecY